MWSLEFIDADGEKTFLTDGRTKGCFHLIGTPDGKLFETESYATGASIHQATGEAVAVAFNCGNLVEVAKELRKKYPTRLAPSRPNDRPKGVSDGQ